MPSRERSERTSFSYCAKLDTIPHMSRPLGVSRSRPSRNDSNPIRRSTSSSRSSSSPRAVRPSLSIRQHTSLVILPASSGRCPEFDGLTLPRSQERRGSQYQSGRENAAPSRIWRRYGCIGWFGLCVSDSVPRESKRPLTALLRRGVVIRHSLTRQGPTNQPRILPKY
jgi:hypothetical protein